MIESHEEIRDKIKERCVVLIMLEMLFKIREWSFGTDLSQVDVMWIDGINISVMHCRGGGGGV